MRNNTNTNHHLNDMPLHEARLMSTRIALSNSLEALSRAIKMGEEPEEIQALRNVIRSNEIIVKRQEELYDRIEAGTEEDVTFITEPQEDDQ